MAKIGKHRGWAAYGATSFGLGERIVESTVDAERQDRLPFGCGCGGADDKRDARLKSIGEGIGPDWCRGGDWRTLIGRRHGAARALGSGVASQRSGKRYALVALKKGRGKGGVYNAMEMGRERFARTRAGGW